MHVRFNGAIAGQNFAYQSGDVVDWPDGDEAQKMVERGIAEELTPAAAQTVAASSGRPVRKHRALEKAATR